MTAPVAQVLRDAAELIERDGWRQGGLVGEHTAVCIIDAIFAAGPRRGYQSIVDAVKAHLGVGVALSTWNDAPDRTEAEVLAALRACADEQEASDG